MSSFTSYDQACAEHRWEVPERVNIATEICDRHPRDKLAMIHEDPHGAVREVIWGELQDAANRFANVLVAHGVRPDVVLADTRAIALGEISRAGGAPQVIELDLTGPTGLAHDSGKLGAALASLLGWREAPPASLEEPGRA